MQQGDKKFVMLLIFLILGIVLAMQFRSVMNNKQQKAAAVYKVDRLKKLLEEEHAKTKEYEESIQKNEQAKEDFLNSITEENDYLKYLKIELDELKLKIGLTDVRGKGVIVKLNDAPARKNVINPNDIIIHDKDIITVLNELKKAGAQAISINNERVINTSEQVCAGPTVRINKRRYPVPFEIKAIGNPDMLYKTLEESEIVAILRQYDIQANISIADDIVIPKYMNYKEADNISNLISSLEVIEE